MVKRKRCKLCNHEDRDDLVAQLETMAIAVDDLDKQMDWPSGTSARHQRNHMGDYVDASNPRCYRGTGTSTNDRLLFGPLPVNQSKMATPCFQGPDGIL